MSHEHVKVINQLQWFSQTDFKLQTKGYQRSTITFSNGFLGYDYYVYEMIQRDLSMSLDKSFIKWFMKLSTFSQGS